ncbi:endonuclease/exonuclease/phosphatase family protein [Mangrovimicrobium sediminis]|uniref:endonuclease/exonuclease/phosphatase family protein n=1 Tax=Mangrovimicrobium sediminis TaxID=2562682 RepID=UPI001436B567|nr:endonuclease/exonuclease/phosphatase family protein [Haliea sp. SAOS-164]
MKNTLRPLAWLLLCTIASPGGSAIAAGEPHADAAYGCLSHLGTLPAATGQVLPEQLRVLSWNIHKSRDAGWSEDLRRLGDSADLGFIQEAALHTQLGELWLGGPRYQSFAPGYSAGGTRTGVMTISRFAPTMQCNFTRTEPWLGTPKAIAVTEHAIQGREQRLLAINIHAINFTLGIDDFAAQLDTVAQLVAVHSGPVILAGDLNTWSAARKTLVERVLAPLQLAPLSFQPDLRTRAFGHALDHIYVRGLTVESTEVVAVDSSDHNPLIASLRFLM